MTNIYYLIGRHNVGSAQDAAQSGRDLTIEEIRQGEYFIEEYTHRILAHSKYPYDFVTEQYVLRENNPDDHSGEKFQELSDLIEHYSQHDFLCWRNPIKDQSRPGLIHYHIAKFRNIDEHILSLKSKLPNQESMV